MGEFIFRKKVDNLSSQRLQKKIDSKYEQNNQSHKSELLIQELMDDYTHFKVDGLIDKRQDGILPFDAIEESRYAETRYIFDILRKGPATFYEILVNIIGNRTSKNACEIWDKVIDLDMNVWIQTKVSNAYIPMFFAAQIKGNLRELTKEKFGIEVNDNEMKPYFLYHNMAQNLMLMKKYGCIVKTPDGKYELKNEKVLDYLSLVYDVKYGKPKRFQKKYVRKVRDVVG
jgi:hypothetical protein